MTQEEYLQLVNEVNSNKKLTQINYPFEGRKEIFSSVPIQPIDVAPYPGGEVVH